MQSPGNGCGASSVGGPGSRCRLSTLLMNRGDDTSSVYGADHARLLLSNLHTKSRIALALDDVLYSRERNSSSSGQSPMVEQIKCLRRDHGNCNVSFLMNIYMNDFRMICDRLDGQRVLKILEFLRRSHCWPTKLFVMYRSLAHVRYRFTRDASGTSSKLRRRI